MVADQLPMPLPHSEDIAILPGMTTMSYDRARGHATGYDVVDLGYNYRLDDLRSAIGLVQLAKLPEDITRRASLRQRYEEALAPISSIVVPFAGRSNEARSNYIFSVRLKSSDATGRDAVRAALAESGVQTSMHYPALHRLQTFAGAQARLPETEQASDSLITLPFFKTMTGQQLTYVVEALKEALGR